MADPTTSSPGGEVAPVDAAGTDPAPVPWQAEDLTSLLDELIEAAEANRVEKFIAKCAENKLTPKLLKEIEADAHFPKTAKALLKRSVPRLVAKWLNKSGVSAEWQDQISVLTAVILIVVHDRKTDAKLDELIETNKKLLEKQKQLGQAA